MDEVDYSEFLYKNNLDEGENYRHIRKKNREIKPKRKHGFNVVIVLLVISCLLLAFFAINGITDGRLKEKVVSAINGNERAYFLAVKKYSDKDACYAQSLLIRQSGAGGYIFSEKNQYVLVYSIFFNEGDCEKVAEKNNAEIFIITIKPREKTLYTELDSAIKKLMDIGTNFELGSLTETGVKDGLVAITSRLKAERERLYSAEGSEGENVALVDLALGGIDGAVYGGFNSRLTLLSNLRYVATSIVINMR